MKFAFGVAPSIFGDIVIAFSSKGIGALYPRCDNDTPYHNILNDCFLERVFYGHELVRGGKAEDVSAEKIIEAFVNNPAYEMKKCELNIPYGSEFQRAIWGELLKIPHGETRTYAQMAEAVGNPRAVRAVGTACGANPLAILIPCHRVVGAGDRYRYRWGADMKKALLERELDGTTK